MTEAFRTVRKVASASAGLAAAIRLAAVCLLITGTTAAAPTAQEIERAAAETIRQLSLQTELPRGAEPPNWIPRIEIPPVFIWVALVCGVLFVLYQFREMIPMFRTRAGGGEWGGTAPDAGPVESKDAAVALIAADELARQGRFVEAMHSLLLRSLAEIRQRRGEPFADSMTSREILRSARLSDAGRGLLRDIVLRVEWSYFGAHPAAEADYLACRESFHKLAPMLRAAPRA